MQMPARRLAARQSDIYFIISDFCFQCFRPQDFRAVFQALLQRLLHLIDDLADLRTLFCRHLAHATENFRHGTLAAQVFYF